MSHFYLKKKNTVTRLSTGELPVNNVLNLEISPSS